jgi:uncharacterized protein
MNRVEKLRNTIDDILQRVPDADNRRCSFVHLYGVSACCALLALRRGQDPDVCITAGLLHDISAYEDRPSPDHGERSANRAKELLRESGQFNYDEISLISEAICHHSDKSTVHSEMAELLKDADVLQHYLCNMSHERPQSHVQRLKRSLRELGIGEHA